MKADLFDAMGNFSTAIELPEELATAQCVTLNDKPYIYVSQGVYRCALGNFVLKSSSVTKIPIAHVYKEQLHIQIHSTRWLSGTVAIARILSKNPVEIPGLTGATITIEDDRPIRLSGLWCPNDEAPPRFAANAFCNTKQNGSKLMAAVLALDNEGRMVVEINRFRLGKVTSMRTAMLAKGLFQTATWHVQ